MLTCDVAVVGGGPAGAAAATSLASAGRRVVLVDRAEFPRDKCCGDGLTTLALRLSERLGLDPTTIPSWQLVDDVVVTGPLGHAIDLPLPRDDGVFAAVATRADYDAAMLGLASKAGATVFEGTRMTSVTEFDDRVVMEADGIDEPVVARYLVAADGVWSPTRKALGLDIAGYRGEWHAFRAYFSNVSERAARELFVFFEADLLPGYAWSFPLADGRANVGFGIQRGGKVAVGDMGPVWEDLLERPSIRDVLGAGAQMEGRHTAWPIPARIDDIPLTGRRTFFVGDAAAACDVMTGEGIGQALLTGMLAAEAIESTGPHGARVATETYERSVRAHLDADHAMSQLLVRAIRHRKGVRAALRVAGANAWTRRNFARWLFEDYPRALIATPRRWHRSAFTGSGARFETAGTN